MSAELAERALAGDRRALAQLVSRFERPDAFAGRQAALALLEDQPTGCVLAVVGAPGAGKSSLLARLVRELVATRDGLRIAVLAVDPASPRSGGALLGDRVRFDASLPRDRVYVRSQSNAGFEGGIGPGTPDAVRLLERLFDLVLVESVGIGQSELAATALADRVAVVVQAHAGDELQAIKAGVMETPDALVVTKSDLAGGRSALRALRSSLQLAYPDRATPPPVLPTSATTGQGLDALVDWVLRDAVGGARRLRHERDAALVAEWARRTYGTEGLRALAALELAGGPDETRAAFRRAFAGWLLDR